MQSADLIINARWIIPVEPDGLVLEHHSLVVRAGTVVALLPTSAAGNAFECPEVLDRTEHALLPGLVNAHGHAAMTLFRGLSDDLPLNAWLRDHMWPAEARWVNAAFVRDGVELALLEMLSGGTTCFADMFFFPDATAHAVADSGLRACVGMVVLEQPTVWARNAEEYLSKGLAVRDQFRGHPRITMSFAPHAPYTVSDQTLDRIRTLADELETPVCMHVHETADEVATARRHDGRRPLDRLDALGLLTPQLLAVHMTELTAAEIGLLATRGVNVVHCPESNLKLASGLCPVAGLLEAGINVALGTDGAASNNDLDMWGEMRTAALLGKGVAGRADVLPAARVLRMATLNGAQALGLAERIGSLAPGKSADFICVDLSAPHCQPVYDPVSQLVYAAGRDDVTDVWVAGQQLLRDRMPLLADKAGILARTRTWGERIGAKHD